jgi:hypothetical protein
MGIRYHNYLPWKSPIEASLVSHETREQRMIHHFALNVRRDEIASPMPVKVQEARWAMVHLHQVSFRPEVSIFDVKWAI